jgi:hypothetical protein
LASFFITIPSPETATSTSIHIPLSLSRIMMSGFCLGWFCQFGLVDSTIWLPCLLDLFVLILVCACTSVLCQILPYHHHHLLYAGYLCLYSWGKPCP